ncbi:MAG: IS21 family transposase [Candidatus Omnitrophica bacterium]|nr:IS21 family transposase [Candidatus Omnitrophota bacterium]
MVSDEQVRRLRKHMQKDGVLWRAASKAGMSEKTARKYLKGNLPSQQKVDRTWRTRKDPFDGVWEEVEEFLSNDANFEAKTLFEYLQRQYPGRFQDSQLRTLQRRIKVWRALKGPAKEVFFEQEHHPGRLSQSDFTHMSDLEITIDRQPFPHLLFHFVLTYSNWETVTICYGENYESLSQGIQNALWELGGVPQAHQTDQLTAAVHQLDGAEKEEFTSRYRGLMSHYGLQPKKIQAGKANENGDVEQSHRRFKESVDQALRLRGSRAFGCIEEYELFLRKLLAQTNAGRRDRFKEEMDKLRPLPSRRLDDQTRQKVRVTRGSTIRVRKNAYSVHSRLIGEEVEARIGMDEIEVWYAQKCVERLPRLRGEGKHHIDYRHIIDWLVRKPGAFENYVYKSDLFPTSRFRMAYDWLKERGGSKADKKYLGILYQAAMEGESLVDDALRHLIETGGDLTPERVAEIVESGREIPPPTEIEIDDVALDDYDDLFSSWTVEEENDLAIEGVTA